MKFLKAFIIILLFNTTAFAEYIHPANIKFNPPGYEKGEVNLPEGTYTYRISWEGILVGSCEVLVSRELGGNLDVFATAKSAKVVSLFYSLRHISESIFSEKNFRSLSFRSWQKENSKEKNILINFNNSGDVSALSWKKDPNQLNEQLDFKQNGNIFDPISAAFLARTLPIEIGKEVKLAVFNGKHLFVVDFNVVERETLNVNGVERKAFRVVPTVQKLTDSEGEKRLKSASIWISDDEKREILRLKSKVLIGSVNAELESYQPTVVKDKQEIRAMMGEAPNIKSPTN